MGACVCSMPDEAEFDDTVVEEQNDKHVATNLELSQDTASNENLQIVPKNMHDENVKDNKSVLAMNQVVQEPDPYIFFANPLLKLGYHIDQASAQVHQQLTFDQSSSSSASASFPQLNMFSSSTTTTTTTTTTTSTTTATAETIPMQINEVAVTTENTRINDSTPTKQITAICVNQEKNDTCQYQRPNQQGLVIAQEIIECAYQFWYLNIQLAPEPTKSKMASLLCKYMSQLSPKRKGFSSNIASPTRYVDILTAILLQLYAANNTNIYDEIQKLETYSINKYGFSLTDLNMLFESLDKLFTQHYNVQYSADVKYSFSLIINTVKKVVSYQHVQNRKLKSAPDVSNDKKLAPILKSNSFHQ